MTRDTAAEVPIHEDVVEELAGEYGVGRDALVAFLAELNEAWRNRLPEMREAHEVVDENEDRVLLLAGYRSDVGELARAIAEEVAVPFDADVEEGDPTPAILFGEGHRRHVQRHEYEAFGGRLRAEYALRDAGVVVVSK